VLTITITFVACPYVGVGEEMPDLVVELEFRESLDQDTLDLSAFRVPMLGVYLAGERQSHEPFYFCREIPGRFWRAAYIDGNLFASSKHVEKICLRGQPRHVWPEDNRTYDCRGNGGNKNRSGRDILRIAYQRVKLGRSCVGEEFESGIKSLGCPDNGNGQNDPTPITGRNLKKESGAKHNSSGCGMNPRVVLAADHSQNASNRMAEAAEATRKLKRPIVDGLLRFGVVLHRQYLISENKAGSERFRYCVTSSIPYWVEPLMIAGGKTWVTFVLTSRLGIVHFSPCL
jgi:hypothetical protein